MAGVVEKRKKKRKREPDADEGEVHQCRLQYRALSKILQDDSNHDITDPSKAEFSKIAERIDKLGSSVQNPREAAVDADVFQQLTRVGLMQSQKLFEGRGLSLEQFLEGVRQRFGSGGDLQSAALRVDWQKLGTAVAPHLDQTPHSCTIFGPFGRELRERKRGERRPYERTSRHTSFVHPDKIQDPAKLGHHELVISTRRMESQHEILTQQQQVDMFAFVTNPGSFSQSVENLMDMAFLVRDGLVRVEIDPAQAMVAKPAPKDKGVTERTNQCVVRYDYHTFQSLVQHHTIQEPAIPHRNLDDPVGKKQKK